MTFLILIFSLMLENSWSLIFPKTSIFLGLFSLVTIFSIYPLFKDDKKYLIVCFIYGLCYDIIFTSTILLNAFLFLIIAYFITKIYKTFHLSILLTLIIGICLIAVYRFVSYFTIITINNNKTNYVSLFQSISSSLIISLIYMLLIRFIVNKLKSKHRFSKY